MLASPVVARGVRPNSHNCQEEARLMAAFQGSPAESHRVESRDQAPPPPLSTRLAGMSMQHAFLAQELEDFDNAAAATPRPSRPRRLRRRMPPPRFRARLLRTVPDGSGGQPADAAAAAAVHGAHQAARSWNEQSPSAFRVMRAVLFVFGEKLVFAPPRPGGSFRTSEGPRRRGSSPHSFASTPTTTAASTRKVGRYLWTNWVWL